MQSRLFWSSLLVFALTACLFLTVLSLILGKSYHDLEEREMTVNWKRVHQALLKRSENLHLKAYDWAKWDDAYDYIKTRSPEFEKTNLVSIGIINMKVNGIAYLDRNNKVVFDGMVSLNGGPKPDLKSIIPALNLKPIGKSPEKIIDRAGLVRVGDSIYHFSARTVTDSAEKKAPIGWTIWLLNVDKAATSSVASDLGLHVSLQKDIDRINHPSLSAYDIAVHSYSDTAEADGLLHDYTGTAIARLEVGSKRTTWSQGVKAIQATILTVLAIGALMILCMVALVRYGIVRRLTHVHHQLASIDPQTGFGHVEAAGTDEISDLAKSVNQLLNSISSANSELEAQREELYASNVYLEETVNERTGELVKVNSVLQHALDGIVEMGPDGVILSHNQTAGLALGRESIVGETIFSFASESGLEVLRDSWEELLRQSRVELELVAYSLEGKTVYLHTVLIRELDESGRLLTVHAFLKDVSDRRLAEEKIYLQARNDSLTGIPNRRHCKEILERELGRGEGEFYVLFIDLDNFKVINDSLGHAAGDDVLRQLAARMCSLVTPQDTVARLGGDEFTIILTSCTDLACAKAKTQEILGTFEEPFQIQDRQLHLTFSAGLSAARRQVETVEEVMRDADTAMYHAKGAGKATFVVFDESMRQAASDRLHLEDGLRKALENGEFVLHYQPVIDLATEEICAVEALIRWEQPGIGLIPPVKFIPLAEQTGLIVPIGDWILREAVAAAGILRKASPNRISVNLNLSQKQINGDLLLTSIKEAMALHSVPGDLITLEITESLAMTDPGLAIDMMNDVKKLGVRLALDDFGTGFSSLSYLQEMPVDILKIDRSFIHAGSDDLQKRSILAAIVSMGQTLQLEVVAEGIETLRQSIMVQKLGCHHAQGYFYAKPMPLDRLLELLKGSDSKAA